MAVAQNKSLNYSIGNKIGNEGAKILGQALRKHTTTKHISLACESNRKQETTLNESTVGTKCQAIRLEMKGSKDCAKESGRTLKSQMFT